MQDKLTELTLKRNRRANKIITDGAFLVFFSYSIQVVPLFKRLSPFSSSIIDTWILFNEIVDNSFIN